MGQVVVVVLLCMGQVALCMGQVIVVVNGAGDSGILIVLLCMRQVIVVSLLCVAIFSNSLEVLCLFKT